MDVLYFSGVVKASTFKVEAIGLEANAAAFKHTTRAEMHVYSVHLTAQEINLIFIVLA